jgi:hypothetical protein
MSKKIEKEQGSTALNFKAENPYPYPCRHAAERLALSLSWHLGSLAGLRSREFSAQALKRAVVVSQPPEYCKHYGI